MNTQSSKWNWIQSLRIRKAIFLVVLFLVPMVWLLGGDRLVSSFLLYYYFPLGAIYSIYIWTRPLNEMMVHVSLVPILLLLVSWGAIGIDLLFSVGLFGSKSLAWASVVGISIFIFFLGIFHLLISYGIYAIFRESNWFD